MPASRSQSRISIWSSRLYSSTRQRKIVIIGVLKCINKMNSFIPRSLCHDSSREWDSEEEDPWNVLWLATRVRSEKKYVKTYQLRVNRSKMNYNHNRIIQRKSLWNPIVHGARTHLSCAQRQKRRAKPEYMRENGSWPILDRKSVV